MTVIVALVDSKDIVHMGADSSASNDTDSMESCENEKVFHKNSFMFGVCGSFRIMNLLRYSFQPREFSLFEEKLWYDFTQDNGYYSSAMEYMIQSFVPQLIKCLKKNGVIEKENSVLKMDASIVVAFKSYMFVVDGDFQVRLPPYENFVVLGSGSEPAKGSLFTSYYNNDDAFKSIETALLASQQYSKTVKGPIYHISSADNIFHVF
jgi:hypothetical protein